MGTSRPKRLKIHYSTDVTDSYPQDPNFYWNPPSGEVTLYDMEDIADKYLQSKVIVSIFPSILLTIGRYFIH